jgi:hypothetical protein
MITSAIAFVFTTCHGLTQPPGNNTFTLSLSDTSCTEAWLNVHLGASFKERTVEIERDTEIVMTLSLGQSDSVVVDTGLSPYQSYTYVAYLLDNSSKATDPLNVRTLDTTTNNFSWQMFQLGNGSLADVTILSDNPPVAYAAGGGVAAKWDGSSWTVKQLYYRSKDYQGNEFVMPLNSLASILAFSDTDIWLASGAVLRWNGKKDTIESSDWTFKRAGADSGSVAGIRLWGTSDKNIYAGGWSGAIRHFDGSSWNLLQTGTTLDIQDIYGAWDAQLKRHEILAVGWTIDSWSKQILEINQGQVTQLSTDPIPEPVASIWFIPNREYVVAGSGFFVKHRLNDSKWVDPSSFSVTTYFTNIVRGNSVNDYFIAGAYGEFLHWNGARCKSFRDVVGLSDGWYSGVATKGNLVIAVGADNGLAIATVGKR